MPLTAKAAWKETLVVSDDGGRDFVFDCGWAVDPPIAYIPADADWVHCVPIWLHDRRDEVVAAMMRTRHVVREGPYPRL